MSRRGALVTVSSLSIIAGLLVGVAPSAMAVQPATTPAASPVTDDSSVDRQQLRERVTDLRDGLCAREVPKGLVRFEGPGGTRLTARVRSQGDTKLLTVVGARGQIGETAVRDRDASGELAWRNGAMTGEVTIALPDHVKVSRSWDQSVTVTAQPSGCGWLASVKLAARGNGASLDLRGSLTESGSYVLRGSGAVGISRTTVPVTGFLRATAPGRSSTTTWRIAGSTGRAVSVQGARLEQVSVALTSARRVVHGSARLVLQDPLLTAPAVLEVSGADTWSARVDGAHRQQWVMPGTDQVVVRTSDLTGSVGMRAGRPHWTLTAPGETAIGSLDYLVDVGFVGRETYTVQARSASGTFLGLPESRPFSGVATQLRITPSGITGALSVETRGEVLLDFPGAWTATTDYIVKPIAGRGWAFDSSMTHTLRSGLGAIHFTGSVAPDGSVELIARGHKEISGTKVPVRGYYNRTSWIDGTLPVWALAAYKDEVEGGRIPLDGGAAFVGGMVVFSGPGSQHHSTIDGGAPQAAMAAARQDRSYDITAPPVTGTGTSTIQFTDEGGQTFSLPVTYDYTDAENWTATAAGTTPSNLYNPFDGLEIPETDFSGTVTESGGTQTWNMTISMQEWKDMAKGIQYKGSFTISNTCPLTDSAVANCPPSDGIFIGGDSTLDFDDPSFPSGTATGAFLTDLSWGWWDGTLQGSASFNGISMSDPDITIWRGNGTGSNPDIILPDLSSSNGNGMNVELCADFTVPIPYVTTASMTGCAAYTKEGSILAQVNTGGDVESSDHNGVSVTSTTLTGYVWNGLSDSETVYLDGNEIDADPQTNYVTADIVVPGNVMHDFGTGQSTSATIEATGSFDLDGNFTIEGTIPVGLSGGGFTLDEIIISMSRQKDDGLTEFDLEFDAECDVVINGNHFPLDVYIGYKSGTDQTITVGLSATGTQSTQPEGTMDFVNLVPTGDFEPENANIVDGSFDGKLPSNIANDGGFERSTNPGDIVVNGSFDDSTGLNAMPNGDFEDGTYSNILDNGDFEDQNIIVNGGFEDNGGSWVGWTTTSSAFTASIADGTASSANGPEDQGDYVLVLANSSASNNATGGLTQTIPNPLTDAEITVTAWVMSNATSNAPFHLQLSSNQGQGSACDASVSIRGATVTAAPGTWTQASVTGTIGDGCFAVQVTLVPENSGTSVQVDAVEMAIGSIPQANSLVSVTRPNIIGTFDSMSSTPLMSGYSSGVSIATDYPGTLRTDGEQSWMLGSSSNGYTYGDFDVTYKVMFPSGSGDTRDIANFGFWLDGNYSTMSGYCFRLQTANGDGGFLSCSKKGNSRVSGAANIPDVAHDTWYQVRLTAVSGTVTAYVVDLSDNSLFATQTLKMPTTGSGLFGQVPDGVKSSTGIRWDDVAFNYLQGEFGWESNSKAPNQVIYGSNSHSGEGRVSLFTTSWTGVPFEYSTGETPTPGQYYTYSAWMRSASGTVTGSVSLSAIGGTSEASSTSFSVGTTWTLVPVTLYVTESGHTDLRPRITINTANAELQIDDLVLQQVPWIPYQSNSGLVTEQITSDDTHSGLYSMAVTAPTTSGASVFYEWPTPAAAGEVLTYSAWVMAPTGVQGTLRITEQSGASSQTFAANGTWQQVSVTRTMQGGTNDASVTVDIAANQAGETLYVDDVVVTGTKINSNEVGIAIPGSPAGWTSITDVLPSTVTPTSVDRVSPTSVVPTPSSVTASASGTSVNVSWSIPSSDAPYVSYFQVQTTSGQNVCRVNSYDAFASTGSESFSCSVSNLSAGSFAFQVRSVNAFNVSGPWSSASNSVEVYQSISPVIVSDASLAHTGEGSLLLQPGAGGTQVDTYTVTPETAPVTGSTWQASVWLAPKTAANSQPVTVTLSAGSNSVSETVTLSSTAGAYTNVIVPLPIKSAATSFSVALSYTDASGSKPVLVDDLSITEINLTPVDDWQANESKGFVAVQGIDDSTTAYEGDGYLLIDNTSAQGQGVFLDAAYKATSGTAHEFSAWLRVPQGASSVAGDLWLHTFDSNGNQLDSYQAPFTATSTWGYFFISLPITKTNATTIRTEIDVPAGATLYVDNVESRDINYWSAVQPSSGQASVVIVDNSGQAANGANYLRFITPSSDGGMGDTITKDVDGNPIDVVAGSSYKLEAYVRSTTGASISGSMSLGTANNGQKIETKKETFTATSSWTPVQMTFQANKAANTLIPEITLNSAGMLDVDELTLTPVIIEQSDPWSAAGSGVTWNVMDDPPNAYDSSYGVMEFSTSTAGSGVKHAVTQSTSVGEQLSATAFVKTAGASVNGIFQVTTTGGTQEVFKQGFTATSEWQMVSIPITIAQTGHTGFTVAVTLNTTGQTLYLDQVALQTNPWTPVSGATQAIVFDGASAQSGSGYLSLQSSSSKNESTYLDMAASSDIGGTYAANTTWYVTAQVRSSSSTQITEGVLSLGPAGGTVQTQTFNATDEWTKVTVPYTVGSTALNSLRVEATVFAGNPGLEIDSVSISDGTAPPDGITTPLPHPESGWIYLWDNAFDVPGLHLWAISAQVDFVNDDPGLGVSATTYQDPTQMSLIMDGTDWIKGDMAVNISETDPCFLFDFESDGGNSGVSLGEGVFTANDFSINFAPRGCQVGPYTLSKGASLSFDGELGDGTVDFDIAITDGDDGPEFTEDIGITDITVGGFDFKEMELSIDLTETDDSITFVGDMVTPMGNFYGSYDLSATKSALVMDGDVSLTDWNWVGGGFDVEEFDYDMEMTVPFGAGECGSFDDSVSGTMDMAKKTSLSFTGQISMNCGKLEILEMDYDYKHGSVTEIFELDYEASTGILAGEVEFDFDRSTSWKFFFHKYNRHPKFDITLAYSMDVDKPSTASATLTGDISVSGGDGSISCTLEVGSGSDWQDDQCSLHVHISIGGGHTYNASW